MLEEVVVLVMLILVFLWVIESMLIGVRKNGVGECRLSILIEMFCCVFFVSIFGCRC